MVCCLVVVKNLVHMRLGGQLKTRIDRLVGRLGITTSSGEAVCAEHGASDWVAMLTVAGCFQGRFFQLKNLMVIEMMVDV